jgi:hypothetical protein
VDENGTTSQVLYRIEAVKRCPIGAMEISEAVKAVTEDLKQLFRDRVIQLAGIYVRRSLNSGGRPLLVVTGDVSSGQETGPFFYVFNEDSGFMRRRVVDGFHDIAKYWEQSARALVDGRSGEIEPAKTPGGSAPGATEKRAGEETRNDGRETARVATGSFPLPWRN